ncbi:hypothetical protein MATL_G00174890 [Megalops atlanticus]|uniref:Uncharacterized protein n=1 Tax=Megalops atlanticus TaxID=7932 RepID=A0A9D3PRR3_MEGAT|nr:hypothetical protein MATL_G00174890 [Megalops atlanticus]
MAAAPLGQTAGGSLGGVLGPPGPVWVRGGETSSTRLLERMINRTALSTQRVLHQHITELGERLCHTSSLSSPSPDHTHSPAQLPRSPTGKQYMGGAMTGDTPWTETLIQWAEEGKERALKQQRESLQARFTEALSARERLEAEQRQGQRVELLAQFEEQCAGLRARMEEEKELAVEEACERLRAQLLTEAEELRDREVQAVHAQALERVRQCVGEAERAVRGECEREKQRDRERLQDHHNQELRQLHSRIQRLQERLDCVTREKMQYEREFKKVQCSYRQFVDLTDSSLHSDYLLRLRRLGKEPGFTEAEVQTDDIITV